MSEIMTAEQFRRAMLRGIPDVLPSPNPFDASVNHAPKRKDVLAFNKIDRH